MKMPMYDDDRSSRRVGFAPEPNYSRRPRLDEEYVMKHFHRHAKRCEDCYDPYSTHISGRTLCDKGHMLAQDVARYMYSKGGRAYSMLDRESLRQRVQVEIPPNCDKVRGLLRAVDHGLRVQKPGPVKSHDQNYYVPSRPNRRSYQEDRHAVPAKESRKYRDDDRRYYEDRRYRYDPKYQYGDQYHYPEKRQERRQSLPTDYAPYGSLWETDAKERKHRQSYYDGNPVYYYKPSKNGTEKRIPRSESPKRESIRRIIPEDYRSSKYGFPSSHRSSKYEYPDTYRSSRYNSPDSYRSSRHGSPDNYQSPTRRASPESYSSKRSSWSPERLYRDPFR
jgi:hypothetical protein